MKITDNKSKKANHYIKDLVSVVVPIYNIENYAKYCIDSIIGQTYQNIEIILVDDGSTDNSGNICDYYADNDRRIKVIHQKNGGLSNARNSGIREANGEYITFVDGDDCIAKNMIEMLYLNLVKAEADISVCSFQRFSDYGHINILQPDNYSLTVYSSAEALKTILLRHDLDLQTAWGKIYKTRLFDDIKYPDGKIHEDIGTTYLLLGKASGIVRTDAKLYFYFQRTDSIMHSAFSVKRLDVLDFCKDTIQYVKKNFPELTNAAYCKYFAEGVSAFGLIPSSKKFTKLRKDIFNNIIKKYRRIALLQKGNKGSTRIYALISYFGFIPFTMFMKFRTTTYGNIRRRSPNTG